jgi:hypothetical protein
MIEREYVEPVSEEISFDEEFYFEEVEERLAPDGMCTSTSCDCTSTSCCDNEQAAGEVPRESQA